MAASAAMPQHQRLILGSLYLSFTVLSRHYGTLWLQGKKSRKVMNHCCHRLHCHQCLIPGDVNLNHSGDQRQDSALQHSYYLLCRFRDQECSQWSPAQAPRDRASAGVTACRQTSQIMQICQNRQRNEWILCGRDLETMPLARFLLSLTKSSLH